MNCPDRDQFLEPAPAGRIDDVLSPDGHGDAGAPQQVARIDEANCIGCVLCLRACPVDAIVGAPGRLHAVIHAWCTGCALCLPPCPVDCITLVAAGREWSREDARAAGLRSRARRLASAHPGDAMPGESARKARQEAAAAALERARTRRAAQHAKATGGLA